MKIAELLLGCLVFATLVALALTGVIATGPSAPAPEPESGARPYPPTLPGGWIWVSPIDSTWLEPDAPGYWRHVWPHTPRDQQT